MKALGPEIILTDELERAIKRYQTNLRKVVAKYLLSNIAKHPQIDNNDIQLFYKSRATLYDFASPFFGRRGRLERRRQGAWKMYERVANPNI